MATSQGKKIREYNPCSPCQDYRTTLEGIHLRMNRLLDREDVSFPSVLKELKREGKNAQYVLGRMHPHHQDQGSGPSMALRVQLVVQPGQTTQDQGQDPPVAGRGCDCQHTSKEGRFPSGGAFGIGRAGYWVLAASQEPEPEGAGGRATHRHGRRLSHQQGPAQDFSTARVTRPLPPLTLHHFSDAEEEIEKVD